MNTFIYITQNKIITFITFLLLIFIIYSNAIYNDFTFDDHSHIESNLYIKSLKGIKDLTFQPAQKDDIIRSHLYRPFAYFIKFIIAKIFGIKPNYFHIANIILYSLNCFLIYLILSNLFSHNLAFLSSLLFLLHPIHTEVVASAISISELLSSTFSLTCILIIIKSFKKSNLIFLYPLFLLLAFLSKETSIITPILILIIMYLKKADLKKYTLFSLLTLIPIIIFFSLRYKVIGSFIRSPYFEFAFIDNPLTHFGLVKRLINSSYIMLKYFALLIFPINLSADYSHESIKLITSSLSIKFIASIIIHIILLSISVLYIKKCLEISFSILLFYIPLLPTSNIIFAGGALLAERFLYLSSLSICLIISFILIKLYYAFPKNKYFIFLIIISILCAYAYLTHQRNYVWKNDFTLFSADFQYKVSYFNIFLYIV